MVIQYVMNRRNIVQLVFHKAARLGGTAATRLCTTARARLWDDTRPVDIPLDQLDVNCARRFFELQSRHVLRRDKVIGVARGLQNRGASASLASGSIPASLRPSCPSMKKLLQLSLERKRRISLEPPPYTRYLGAEIKSSSNHDAAFFCCFLGRVRYDRYMR